MGEVIRVNNKLFLGFAVVLVGVGIGWFVLKGNQSTSPAGESQKEEVSETPALGVNETEGLSGTSGTEEVAKMTVSYGPSGFSPNTVTVKKGTTVRFVNEGDADMWVASAVHPTHQVLPGFDQLKSVGKGGVYDYTFTKVGTWKYHNHVAPQDAGSVVVTE